MFIQDSFDTVPPPSDFGPEPSHHHAFFETGILIVLVVVAIWILSRVYNDANFRAARRPKDAVTQRVDRVAKAMSDAARANQSNQVMLAVDAKTAIDKQFAACLRLSEELNKHIGPLNKALEGMKEEDAPIRPIHGPSTVSGGTVINIAVGGSGNVESSGGSAAVLGSTPVPLPGGAPHPTPEPMTPEEKSAALWTAVQRIFNAWKNRTAIVAAFHAAQAQLTASPLWQPPPEEMHPGHGHHPNAHRRPLP